MLKDGLAGPLDEKQGKIVNSMVDQTGKLNDLIIGGNGTLPEICSIVVKRPFGNPSLLIPWDKVGSFGSDKVVIVVKDGAGQLTLIAAKLSLRNPGACEFAQVDAALDKLAGASFPIKQRLLLACAQTVSHDNQIRAEEGELLRAFADSLGCPMPPLLDGL